MGPQLPGGMPSIICITRRDPSRRTSRRSWGFDADDPPPAYFADGLTARSSCDEILKTRGIRAEFPYPGFGAAFVALPSVCVVGEMLAIADSRDDNGVRVSTSRIHGRGQAGAAPSASGTARADAAARASSDAGSDPRPPVRPDRGPVVYWVSVYRIIETGLSPTRVPRSRSRGRSGPARDGSSPLVLGPLRRTAVVIRLPVHEARTPVRSARRR